jgi:putative addiction module component (TIGR02574 family)
MALTYEQLRDEALTLPIDQRLVLADTLYRSADNDEPNSEVEFTLHPDWHAELERRSEEVRSGRAATISGEEVKKIMDARVRAL